MIGQRLNIPEIHKETGEFWDEIAGTYYPHGESGEAESIEFLRSGGTYLYENELPLLGNLAP